jgi:hypothetical protein
MAIGKLETTKSGRTIARATTGTKTGTMEHKNIQVTNYKMEGEKELIKTFLKKIDYDRGHKRVMLYLTIPEAEILSELSSLKSIRPASLVRMIAIEGLRKARALYPSNTLPGQQELFEKKKGKKKK